MAGKRLRSVHWLFDPDFNLEGPSANRTSKGMPIIHCRCGAEILVLPDVREMNKALESHIASHKLKSKRSEERLREFLIEQLLNIVAAA